MKCQQCREIVLDITRRVADPAAEEQARGHASSCTSCMGYLRQQQDLAAGLRALAAATAREVPSERLERRLLEAIQAEALEHDGADEASVGLPAPPAPLRRPNVRQRFAAAAAIVLAATLTARWQGWWGGSPSDRPSAPRAVSAAARKAGPSPLVEQAPTRSSTTTSPGDGRLTEAVREGVRQAAADTGRVPVRARRAAPPLVQAVGFVPLPAAEMLPPFERGEIVRVRIRLESLVRLGFTVQPDAADTTPINADLLVGQDGQPRAIRLVTTDSRESRSRR